MNTRSGRSYGDNQLSQQQRDDLLLDVVHKLGALSHQQDSLSKRVDAIWSQLFDKPASSGEKNVETEDVPLRQDSSTKEEIPHDETVSRLPFTQFTTPHYDSRSYQPRQLFQPNYNPRIPWQSPTDRLENHGYRVDDITKRVRVDVPDFHGKLDPQAFQDWVTSMDDYFEWYRLPTDMRVRFVKMKLKGQARVWWNSVEEQLHRLRQTPITEWGEMKLRLQEKYLPMDYEESLFEELLALRQGGSSVDDYTHRFHELSIRSQVSETERQTIARYKAGLREDIRRELLTVRLVSIEEAYQIAVRIETQMRTPTSRHTNLAGWNNATSRGPQNQDRTTSNAIADKGVLLSPSQDARKGKFVMGSKPNKGKEECYRCGGRGHYAVVCPTREQKPILLCDEEDSNPEIHDGQASTEDVEIAEEQLEGSNLPLCVIRRILTGQKKEDADSNEWVRTNIFHTRVEHEGKALNLIIDNGSGMNVISQEAVNKLKLPMERHPKPYKVSWVDDTSIPVKARCLVSFSLGNKYKDAVWCDIIPMKACHLLLGRPWLYDRRVQYE